MFDDLEGKECSRCGSQNLTRRDPPFDRIYTCNKCGEADYIYDCFIATAVYGSSNAPEVETLRGFRDGVLMNSGLGRSLVDFYYSGAGRRVAGFIEDKLPSAIPVIRKGLDFFVEKHNADK
jgi:hypothetical protein